MENTDKLEWTEHGTVVNVVNKLYDATFGNINDWWNATCEWWYHSDLLDYEAAEKSQLPKT